MLNLNKKHEKEPKPEPTFEFKNYGHAHVRTYHCAQLLHTIQHRTAVLIFHPPNRR